MVELGVNIDHVATLRQARRGIEPDPVWAAIEAQLGGADGITMHLREDRRHIRDEDLHRVKQACQVKLNLEMAATGEMVDIARKFKPTMVTLVPEGREEITTEGGLDVTGQFHRLKEVVAQLREAGLTVISAFVDALPTQIDAAAAAGFDTCEVHTGPYANAWQAARGGWVDPGLQSALQAVAHAGRQIIATGMRFNAGHGLNYANVRPIADLADLTELHIGHSVVSRAVFVGLRQAVAEMKRLTCHATGIR